MATQPAGNPAAPGRPARVDLQVIAEMVPAGSRVLDVGCGDGALLEWMVRVRGVTGRGIELSQVGVNQCVARGLSVVQGDADKDLVYYPDQAFDYVVLSQTIQATQRPGEVLEQLLRIGRHAIVSFPNFGHWRARVGLGLLGRMPVTKFLPDTWYNTPNIHFCTIRDFVALCDEMNVTIERKLALNVHGKRLKLGPKARLANLFGEQAVFLLRR